MEKKEQTHLSVNPNPDLNKSEDNQKVSKR